MEHVSTLCAISTVGIAATGLALARLDHPAAFQNPAGSGDTTLSRITPSETVNPNTTRRRSALAAVPSKGRTGFQSIPTGSGQNLVLSQRRRERRRRQTVTAPLSPAVDETAPQSREPTTNRPSSSWLRRISIISSTASSSTPSPTTTAPSLHGHSTQPHTRRNSTAKVPNKLVKRSNSQQSVKHLGNRTKSTNLSSRRPATSHHWSGDNAHRSSPGREPDLSVPPTFSESMIASERYRLDSNTQRWRPFFGSASSRRRRDSTRNTTIVTIKPNQPLHPLYHLIYPTLTLPSTLQQSSIDGNMAAQSSSTDPISFNDPFSPRNNGSGPRPKKVAPSDQRRLVRSSSISDLSLNPGKPKDGPLKGDVRRTLTTAVRSHGKDRIVSNPLPRDSGKDGSPRLRRKRNFTESDTFNRPQTAPHTKQFSHKPANNRVPSPQHHHLASSAYPSRSTDVSSSYGHGGLDHKSSPVGYPSYGTSPPIVRYSRNKRLSGATADWASTVIGSDDTRVFTSADEDDQSDSVFDSFRTRISSQSHGGHRGPNIETIFQDTSSAIDDKHGGSVTVEGLGFENLRLSQFTPRSSVSDLESNTTPLALSTSKNTDATPTPPARCALKNSPHKNPRILQTQDCNFDFDENGIIDDDDDDDDDDYGDDCEIDFNKSFWENLKVLQQHSNIDGESPSLTRKSSAIGTKASVFDWSEQTWNERDPQGSEVRPSTVHGKQGLNLRSTRRANRKAPSAMHLRSQSVPVSRDGPVPTDNRQPSAKFGTWGLGQKGVSEDWDGDFDFEDDDDEDGNLELGGGISSSSGRLHTMSIPTAILERQASVHGQYGQVQELTRLVDELKRLRIQGNALQVVNGPAHELWKEADGIVNLATFEDDEPNAKPPRSPSSCGSFDDFNESPSPPQKAWRTNDSDTKRPPLTLWSDMDRNSNSSYKVPSAKVPSVLESIYQQRGSSDTAPVNNNANETPQKLPFDTQSLKELVTRAGIVTRALKDIIRRAEGVAPCEDATSMMDPPFSQIFTPRGTAL